MTEGLGMLAKSVERSHNLQGPIRKDFWLAYTELTAGLATILSRQEEGVEARERRENSAALDKVRARWASEKEKMEAELGRLRIRVALLEEKASTRGGANTDAEIQTDLDLDLEVIDALTGDAPDLPRPTFSDATLGGTPAGASSDAATTRPERPAVVSIQKLRESYFRPPLRGAGGERGGKKEKKRAKALTEDGLREALSRVLPAVLTEMGLLPALRVVERPRIPPAAGKTTKQPVAAPQKRAGNAVVAAAKPAQTQEETTPSILQLWTEVASKKKRKGTAKAANLEAAKTAPTKGRPLRVLPAPSSRNPPPQYSSTSSRRKKKRVGKGGGRSIPGNASGEKNDAGPARATKIRPPTTAAVTVTCADPAAYAQVLKTARERVNLTSLGIEDLRPRRAVTGALILEVKGADNATKADALAEGIREALGDREDVRACTAKAGCPVCKDAGRPAEHRIGAKGCLANKPQKAPLSAGGQNEAGPLIPPTPTPAPAAVEMEAPLPQRERSVRNCEGAAVDRTDEMEVEEPQGCPNNAP
ncbi:uncharacterized protein LOC120357344 [Solenopsis invicta]|uniref:uncharacterized protein LOC120357344 n=1 Tax=Solenopsis invicta TaxID=13686 RepID=UPI00193E9A85|nr:uncharacterized protein LOC120357344 [Solenopsis invicta]